MTNSQFGEKILALKEKQNLYLRQVLPFLEMGTVQLSKIEKGLLQLKNARVPIIAYILKASSDELVTFWLVDKVYSVAKDQKFAKKKCKKRLV
jgi:transcriptional regulator with XRE-family HTH domain